MGPFFGGRWVRFTPAPKKSTHFHLDDSIESIISYDVERVYRYRIATFDKLYSLTANETYKDSSEATYEQAMSASPSYFMLQDFLNRLDERLEADYKKHRVASRDFQARIDKYLQWGLVLIDSVMVSTKTTKEILEEKTLIQGNMDKWRVRRGAHQPQGPNFKP